MRGSVDFSSPSPSIAAIRQSSRTSTVITRARTVASSGRPTLPRARHAWTRTTPSASLVAFNIASRAFRARNSPSVLQITARVATGSFPASSFAMRTRVASTFCCSLS